MKILLARAVKNVPLWNWVWDNARGIINKGGKRTPYEEASGASGTKRPLGHSVCGNACEVVSKGGDLPPWDETPKGGK
jgi:hypothetical protein